MENETEQSPPVDKMEVDPAPQEHPTIEVPSTATASAELASSTVTATTTVNPTETPLEENADNDNAAIPMQIDEKPTLPAPLDPVEQLQEAFEDYVPGDVKLKRTSKTKRKSLQIRLSQNAVSDDNENKVKSDSSFSVLMKQFSRPLEDQPPFVPSSYDDWSDAMAEELEVSLKFYEETHEEQLPEYEMFVQKRKEEALKVELASLEEADKKGKTDIDKIMQEQMKEKEASMEKNLEKYKLRIAQDDKRDNQRLKLLYQRKVEENRQRMSQTIKHLQRQHQTEIQQAMQRHHQNAQQRRLTEQVASAEWQNMQRQIQQKQQHQMQQIGAKGEELKHNTELDFKREQEKIRGQHDQKVKELEAGRQKYRAKLYAQFQQFRQRHHKRHLLKIAKQRAELINSAKPKIPQEEEPSPVTSSLSKTASKSFKEEKAELSQPLPLKTSQDWLKESPYPRAGAAARHKNRKGVMGQSRKQLSVEIHNEGLWIAVDKGSDGDDKRAHAEHEYIPWGRKALIFLESIVCGEIPSIYEASKFGEAAALQGGQVRCSITDLRTSEETASIHRVTSLREQVASTLEQLEKKVTDLATLAKSTEKAASKSAEEEREYVQAAGGTAKEVQKAQRRQDEFRQKFKSFLGPDGTPTQAANPNDRQELMKAAVQYKNLLETAMRRDQAMKRKLTETKTATQKLTAQAKAAIKNATFVAGLLKKKRALAASSNSASQDGQPSRLPEAIEVEKAAVRVKDVISSLRKTAEKRKDQCLQKQSNKLNDAWVQSFPGLSGSLKKSLWQKMHRRKQQIILRPSEESLVNGLKERVSQNVLLNRSRPSQRKLSLEAELVKAEQLFLLSAHPLATGALPTVPSSKSADGWAEPGWQLHLDVTDERDRTCVLPQAPVFPLVEKNASEISSAPGRQACSLLRTSHLKSMTAPLSTFAIASSPAEQNTSLAVSHSYTAGDPFNMSTEDLELGYSFSVRTPLASTSKPSLSSKKRSVPAKEKTESKTKKSTSDTTKARTEGKNKRRSTEGVSPSPRSQKRKIEHKASTTSRKAPSPTFAENQRRPSGLNNPGNLGMMPSQSHTYAGQYRQGQASGPNQQMSPSQQQKIASPKHQQGSQQSQQQQQRPSQYSNHQMAQIRMMQQMPQASPGHSMNAPAGFQHMQQFFTPSPLNHPGTGAHGMTHAMAAMHGARLPMHAPPMMSTVTQGPNAGTRGSLPPQHQQQSRQQKQTQQQQNDQSDPLYMLKDSRK